MDCQKIVIFQGSKGQKRFGNFLKNGLITFLYTVRGDDIDQLSRDFDPFSHKGLIHFPIINYIIQ